MRADIQEERRDRRLLYTVDVYNKAPKWMWPLSGR